MDCLSLNLPPLCNYHCNICFASGTLDNQVRLAEIKHNSLTPVEYTSIIQEAKNLGVRHLEISGEGEPDLPIFRNTLHHIVNQATESGIHTTIFVNGSWLDEHLLKLLQERNTSLAISIKYANPEKYDEAVGIKGAYERVMPNIILATRFLGGHTENNGTRIYRLALNSTVLKDNLRDNYLLRSLCEEHDIFFHSSTLIPHGRSEGVLVDVEEQNAISRELSDSSIILADSSSETLGFPVCGTFYFGLGINYDGEALFDAHADDTRGMIGNIREIGLVEAIRKQREMRNSFYREGRSSYCPLRDSTYQDFISCYASERR